MSRVALAQKSLLTAIHCFVALAYEKNGKPSVCVYWLVALA
ncbi:hypothetical protein [Vibrio sp. HN007]